MTKRITYLTALILALLLTRCKKEHFDQHGDFTTPIAGMSLATAAVSSINVETIYGSPYATGALVDGSGKTARFNSPMGMHLMPDGTLYVADMLNNAIRKISAAGVVSTVKLKPSNDGFVLANPIEVGVEHNTGTFHIIQQGNLEGDPYFNQSWIFTSNGDFVATSYVYYEDARSLARNPYEDFYYFSQGNLIEKHIKQPTGEIYGPHVPIDDDKLEYPENEGARGFSWNAIAVGFNKVIYFSTGKRIYKYTPGGVTERIFENLPFTNITSMVFNKDSRTMYVADGGYIKRVDSGKLTVIAGPRGTNDGRDGANLTADVNAGYLALAKGENVLYFTDARANTIRKITLK
jgi:hypothetical protein